MCVFKGDEHGLVSDIVESNIIGVTDERPDLAIPDTVAAAQSLMYVGRMSAFSHRTVDWITIG
jgi:hypothetical protein